MEASLILHMVALMGLLSRDEKGPVQDPDSKLDMANFVTTGPDQNFKTTDYAENIYKEDIRVRRRDYFGFDVIVGWIGILKSRNWFGSERIRKIPIPLIPAT